MTALQGMFGNLPSVSSGPLSFAPSIKLGQIRLTYADCVGMASNTNPRIIGLPSSAVMMVVPLFINCYTEKVGTGPSSPSFTLRYQGAASGAITQSVNALFANGGTGIQFDADSCDIVNMPFTFNTSLRGVPLMLYNGSATAGVFANAFCVITVGYTEFNPIAV